MIEGSSDNSFELKCCCKPRDLRHLWSVRLALYPFVGIWWALGGFPAEAAHTQARLLLALETARPGDTVLAGIHMRMDPGWHTYSGRCSARARSTAAIDQGSQGIPPASRPLESVGLSWVTGSLQRKWPSRA